MTFKEINKALASKIKSDELVEIFRSEIDEVSSLGNVVMLSQELLCFQNITDFCVDGYRIVCLKDITDISTCEKNDTLSFMNMIYKKERLFPESQAVIDAKSWNGVFKSLSLSKTAVTVECAFDDAIDYYFGWIKSVNDNVVTMQCFDGSGNRFKDEVKVNLNFVTQLMFGNKYIELMAKYVQN